MTITETSALTFVPLKTSILSRLSIDGYFRSLVTLTGDATGEILQLVHQEPADKLLQSRMLWVQTLMCQRTALVAGADDGFLRVIGKAEESYEAMYMKIQADQRIAGLGNSYYADEYGGRDLGETLRNRGWFIPAHGAGAPTQFQVIFEVANTNTIVYTSYLYGYYKVVQLR